MGIALVRIDDRLIHGQVVEGWLRYVGATRIVIVNDDLSRKETEQVLFSLAVPSHIAVEYRTVDEAAARFASDAYAADTVLVLVERPREIVSLLKRGASFTSVNVGGMHFAPGKSALADYLYLDKSDQADFDEIASHHVELEGRALPTDKKLSIMHELSVHKLFNP